MCVEIDYDRPQNAQCAPVRGRVVNKQAIIAIVYP